MVDGVSMRDKWTPMYRTDPSGLGGSAQTTPPTINRKA